MSEREIVKKQVYPCREYLKITRKVKAMVVKKTGGTAGTVQVLHPYTCQPLGYQWFMMMVGLTLTLQVQANQVN